MVCIRFYYPNAAKPSSYKFTFDVGISCVRLQDEGVGSHHEGLKVEQKIHCVKGRLEVGLERRIQLENNSWKCVVLLAEDIHVFSFI